MRQPDDRENRGLVGSVKVGPMLQDDLNDLLELERATSGASHWSEQVYREVLSSGAARSSYEEGMQGGTDRRVLVARIEGGPVRGSRLAGFAGGVIVRPWSVSTDEKAELSVAAEIETVVVRSDLRRRGIARALCGALLRWMGDSGVLRVELEVRASNAEAMALYRSLGFVEQGRRSRYYHDPLEDAVLMALVGSPLPDAS